MSEFPISRRFLLIGTASFVPAVAFGQNQTRHEGCEPIDRLILKAYDVANHPASAGFSVDPIAIAEAQAKVDEALKLVGQQIDLSDAAQRAAALDTVEAVGTSLLFIGGIALGAAAGPAIVAGVAFSGTMLLARAALAPERLGPEAVLTNVAGSRVPGLIQAFEEGATVASKNVGNVQVVGNASRVAASSIVGGAFAAFSVYQAVGSTNDFVAAQAKLRAFETDLLAAKSALQALLTQDTLNGMRQACGLAVAQDLEGLWSMQCRELQ